jgi:hypothetical protein
MPIILENEKEEEKFISVAYSVTLSDSEGSRFFAEPVLSTMRFFATLRMTGGEGLRMTNRVAKQSNEFTPKKS